jgi:hypothetical protein
MSNSPFGQLTRRSQDHRPSRTLSKTLSSGRTRSSPGVAARPIAPADLAQARYFEADIREVNRQINEADRIIGALRNRFPHRP